MSAYNGQNFAMCGKTIGSFRRNVLFWLKLMLKSRGYRVSDHRADNLVEISRGQITNYFYIFGGKDERSQDLIQGITLAGLFCDEVALMPESVSSTRQPAGASVTGSKYWFNCNPDGHITGSRSTGLIRPSVILVRKKWQKSGKTQLRQGLIRRSRNCYMSILRWMTI